MEKPLVQFAKKKKKQKTKKRPIDRHTRQNTQNNDQFNKPILSIETNLNKNPKFG